MKVEQTSNWDDKLRDSVFNRAPDFITRWRPFTQTPSWDEYVIGTGKGRVLFKWDTLKLQNLDTLAPNFIHFYKH